jgi:hypothetical protein
VKVTFPLYVPSANGVGIVIVGVSPETPEDAEIDKLKKSPLFTVAFQP